MEKRTYNSSFNLELLFGLPEQPASEQIFNYKSSEMEIPVQTDSFTIVLSRDVRRNTFMAAELAFNAAHGDLTKDVWYVNTYAGVNFLKECFQKLFDTAGLELPSPPEEEEEPDEEPAPPEIDQDAPPPEPAYDSLPPHPSTFALAPGTPAPPQGTAKFLADGTLYTFGYGNLYWKFETEEDRRAQLARQTEANKQRYNEPEPLPPLRGGELDPSHVLPNLRVFHVPIGHWSTLRLLKDIRQFARMGCRQIIIINSFEYAPLTRGRKERMARELVQLCDKFHLSIVIFSHEMKKDVEAGLPGRGPIGIIAAKASTVSRFPDPFEKFYGTRDESKRP
jgi:hypothetical protein